MISNQPTICIAGGGAAGLWTALALLDFGWSGTDITIIEPDAKTGDDHTWSYWATEPILPESVKTRSYTKLKLSNSKTELISNSKEYTYYSLRSSQFYAYAKRVLADASVLWVKDKVASFSESEKNVIVYCELGDEVVADYFLDSRPPTIDLNIKGQYATLQHFGGWFVESDEPCFDVETVTFMDFIALENEVGFFYAIPSSDQRALIELAIFSKTPWSQEKYNDHLQSYLSQHFPGVAFAKTSTEYGVIPMTDAPLWNAASERVWPIGTRGGWVQPSSGYAFTRMKRFAYEVAQLLGSEDPRPWKPSLFQQALNSIMLGHIIENPGDAGNIFLNLFQKNGADRTFSFLDERAGFVDTLRVMWNSPKLPFTLRALKEVQLRLTGVK